MIDITALSTYLLEDLHEYHESSVKQFPFNEDFTGIEHSGYSSDCPVCRDRTRNRTGRKSLNPFRIEDSCRLASFLGRSIIDTGGDGTVSAVFGILERRLRDAFQGPSCQHTTTDPFGNAVTGETWDSVASPARIASEALVRSFTKKFRDEITASAEDAAYNKFLRINNKCAGWELSTQFSWEEELVGLLKKELDDFFHPNGELLIPDENAIYDRGRTGPGASLGANGVDFYTKLFSSNLTATSFDVYYKYAAWCAADPNWRDAEFTRLTTFGLPKITCESSVSFVQKNRDTMRTICTEPTLNMYVQLGIGAFLEDRLNSYFGIDLSVQQERNAELARLGSIAGAISTIDLESASDSMSLGMLEEVLPQWVFDLLCTYRCPFTKVRGERVLLQMISTMGNGFTFPLQTILFSCCVQAVSKQMSARMHRADASWSPWGVFGDDIAVPTFMVDRLVRLLNILGFHVNSEKSYTGKYEIFRESCGRDYYLGHNVRGVYIKTLRTPQSRYVAINLLNDWSGRWGIPLKRTIGYLRDSVRVLAIPPWKGHDAGIRVPLEALETGFTWNPRNTKNRDRFLFKYYEAHVPALRVLDDVIAIPRNLNRVTRRLYSPSGLLIAAIGGYLKGGRIPLALKQGENPCYRMKSGATSLWGPTDEQVRAQGPVFWERWKTAVLVNFGFKDPEA
ncbi:RNA-directed RNA polymerase [ssRNA phage Zoerhiza.4_15]|uniref:RNA-directed RNA polymerase n=2 Tax=Norzivirales TaxID=2842247 RepID=A0A8S5KXZ5_9VIRU|nr:RNA-directed RNA polymerase [ssRNA phage Zoerhiza.4_15]QDH88863.1 MAG: RNA-dependent RNA polymerase [Leviviridae sp.]DAD50044.1 TPA_asm: RNA-directed RNA polymerase [ssRNA phage Zoerhiza.4_15]